MTEDAYQEARKVMQLANSLRGFITKAKADVAKWSNIEDAFKNDLQPTKAVGPNKMLQGAIRKLDALRDKFANLQFPDPNYVKEVIRCNECGRQMKEKKVCECKTEYV